VLSKLDPKKWEGTPKGVQLEEDLIRMGCMGLYEKPWIFQKGHAVEELLPPGTPRGVYRANPLVWTREVWRGVYSFAEKKGWRPGTSNLPVETSYIPVDTPNPPVDLPVEFLNSLVDSLKTHNCGYS
jgi:hypothetical protein